MTKQTPYQICSVEQSIFRAYDIRGIVGSQINGDVFYTIARAIGYRLHTLGRAQIVLARDGRLTSPDLAQAITAGLLDSGIDVVDLGAVPTPVMYYATHVTGIDSGIMVTGSHNPSDYNGIKIVLAGTTLAQDEIQTLYELIQTNTRHQGQGQYQTRAMLPDYCQRILSDVNLERPLRVVADCGNGIGGVIVPVLLRQLGCEVIDLYCEVDGRFPNHHPDPSVESNLVDLKAAVQMHKADLGLAFDGDADRLGVVTNEGTLIWPDRLLMFYAPYLLRTQRDATIVYDVKCSRHLTQVIQDAGGKAKMCPTGHSLVKKVMKDEQAILAGEMSGHIFFKDRWYGFDDAVYSACRLLELLSQSSSTVEEQFSQVPNSIATPEIKIPIYDEKKFVFMQSFAQNAQFPNAELIHIDGLRVEFPHGWGLLRASNTTPCLVARFEAHNEQGLQEIQTLFRVQLQALDDTLSIPF
ncbi:MAG: phosphomannomutase/phosphoglucomutase [Legionellaceae bacterium]|nr:phosphomannomutase/phosphoglucomutase [Legionellaceae bacterium]MBP9774494.1 phosphomannomutase/phosphoglucomutase [Legionellaceae bacterium]